MTTRPLGLPVGLVDAGRMGATHFRAGHAAGAEPVDIAASTEASARAFGGRHEVRRPPAPFKELSDACDVIELGVPTDLDAPLTTRAAEAGRHVVCEKPIALTVGDGHAMIDARERHVVRLSVAHVLRFFPAYRGTLELILDGALGGVRRVRLERASEVPAGSRFGIRRGGPGRRWI